MTPYYEHAGVTLYHDGDLAHKWEEALGLVAAGRAHPGEARPIVNDGPEANELVANLPRGPGVAVTRYGNRVGRPRKPR